MEKKTITIEVKDPQAALDTLEECTRILEREEDIIQINRLYNAIQRQL